MTYNFDSFNSNNITQSETILFQCTKKTLLLNINVTNIKHQTVPLNIYIIKYNDDLVWLAKNKYFDGNSSQELFSMGKLVLYTGDKLCVQSDVDNAFNIYTSVLQGIA